MGLCIVCTDDFRQIAQKYRENTHYLFLDSVQFHKNLGTTPCVE